jgi:hypothetical protein
MAATDMQPKSGPVVSSEILEVQGIFPSDAALQDAIQRLELAGFDHADFSLPLTEPPARQATPEAGAENPHLDEDNRQIRTLHASGVGSAAALAAAGAVIGTGGAVAPAVAAAIAAGAGGALLTETGSHIADAQQHDTREELARQGRLVLAVRAPDAAKQAEAVKIMQASGATRAEAVRRVDNAVDSTAWTG